MELLSKILVVVSVFIVAAPLSIGTESYAEYMDIRLVDRIDPADAMARLNANMTDEMQVIDAYYTEVKLTDLKWLAYSIDIKTDGASADLAESCVKALLSDRVLVTKKAKPWEEAPTVDIRPLIKEISAECRGDIIHLDAMRMRNITSRNAHAER